MTGSRYDSVGPIKLILGIEADCPPDTNAYWRLGYSFPIQLTQWALASAPGHPVLSRYIDNLSSCMQDVAAHNAGDLRSASAIKELRRMGPLNLTGPVAVTVATKSWLEENAGLRWNSLTGLQDGGRSKVIDDVLILPITGLRY